MLGNNLQENWAEIRRLEALERVERKKNLPPLNIKTERNQSPEQPKKKRRRKSGNEGKREVKARGLKKELSRNTCKKVQDSPQIHIPPKPQVSRLNPKKRHRVLRQCPICSIEFEVAPSREKHQHTCREPQCTTKLRSLRQQARNKDRAIPRCCNHPSCCNFLDPDKNSHKQKKYCSVRCAVRHRLGLD